MKKAITGVRRFVGLDVHAETIAAAMAEKEEAVRDLGTIPNREESVRKLVKKLNEGGAWAACYEAGPTGYTLYWQLTKSGVPCERTRITWNANISSTALKTGEKSKPQHSRTGEKH